MQTRRRRAELSAGAELLLVTPCLEQRDGLSVVSDVLIDEVLGGSAGGEIRAGRFCVECSERLEELGSDLLGGQARRDPLTRALVDSSVGVTSANMVGTSSGCWACIQESNGYHSCCSNTLSGEPVSPIDVILPSTTTTSVDPLNGPTPSSSDLRS